MSTFLMWSLPLPVALAPGSQTGLTSILSQSFGTGSAAFSQAWIAYYDVHQLQVWDFRFWNPSAPSVAVWSINATATGAGFNNQTNLQSSSFGGASLTAGDDIGAYAYVTVPASGIPNSYSDYIQYAIVTIDPVLMNPAAGYGEPTAGDIVAAAYRYDARYGFVANDNDCHNIANAVAAAAGATLPYNSGSLDPTQNESGGFWRVVYRGSDASPVSNWQTLVKPGDIVRMGWTAGGQHTTTVLAVSTDGSIVVYDNSDFIYGVEGIGVHTVNYDQKTIASEVTIYRLTTDGLYFEQANADGDAIPGTIFNDQVVGGVGNDSPTGAHGDDVFSDPGGSNVMDGGGGYDRIVLPVAFAQATLVHNADRSWTITAAGVTDKVSNIELAQFSDRVVSLRALDPGDLNGDGSSDLMLRNGAGVTYLWTMNGATVANGATTSVQVGENWGIREIADFNGDGNADVLWSYINASNASDPLNGVSYVSFQNGATATGGAVVQQLASVWQVAGVGDFNGDGKSDVLYRNSSTGQAYLDIMNGSTVNWAASGFTSAQVTDPNWQIAGIADFNGDGDADVLWRYNNASNAADPLNGTLYEWQMNGTSVTSAGLLSQQAGVAWQVAGTGDFNGDGKSDILFRNSTNGITYIDFMNGTNVLGSSAPTQWQIDNSWAVASIGDFNGDGMSDILFQQNSTGNTYIWQMNGANVTSGALTSSQAGTGWTVQNGVLIG